MDLYKREKYLKKIRPFYNAYDLIKVISGVRRCGKSSLMQMIADELRNHGIKRRISYILIWTCVLITKSKPPIN